MNVRLKKISVLFLIFLLITAYTGMAFADSTTVKNTGGAAGGQELHAFYPAYINYSPDLEKFIDGMDSISFAWGRLYYDRLNAVDTVKGENNNTMFYYPEDFAKPVKYAKSKGKPIQISIFSDSYNAERILPYGDKRAMAVQAIGNLLRKSIISGEALYYDGVVIDFEGLRDKDSTGNAILYDGKPISAYFNDFLGELKKELGTSGKKLYVAVNPRLYYDGFDYRQIARTADRMIMMAHDYEPATVLKKSEVEQYTGYNSLEPIDSLAPINKIKLALEDVKNSIDAGDLSKVWLQLAFDSAQWRFDASAPGDFDVLSESTPSKEERLTPTYAMIKNRVDNLDGRGVNITYSYNNELQTPSIQYFNSFDKTHNIIVYEDSSSMTAKINAAKAYGIGGVSIWSLGNIPDYNDANGEKFHLDIWKSIQANVKGPAVLSADAGKTVKFSDSAVESSVRNKIGKLTGDIYESELAGIYRIKLTGTLNSLDDLKYMKNLEYLDIHSTGISDIKPLASLESLRVLYVQRNNIADISPIAKLIRLEVLSLNGNLISDIKPLKGLTALEKLYLKENRISDVTGLRSLVNLKTLILEGNPAKSYTSLNGYLSKLVEKDF